MDPRSLARRRSTLRPHTPLAHRAGALPRRGRVHLTSRHRPTGPSLTPIVHLQFLRWQIVGAFDILMEVCWFVVPVVVVWKVQMRVTKKARVVARFALRLGYVVRGFRRHQW